VLPYIALIVHRRLIYIKLLACFLIPFDFFVVIIQIHKNKMLFKLNNVYIICIICILYFYHTCIQIIIIIMPL